MELTRPGINDGSVPLLDLVKALGEYLTSTDENVRLQGLLTAWQRGPTTEQSRIDFLDQYGQAHCLSPLQQTDQSVSLGWSSVRPRS